MTTTSKTGSVVLAGLFWGSVWGLYEATAGWFVHNLIRVPGAASILMVPFAVFCMDRALRSGGSLRAVAVAAATASTLKLLDLLLPALSLLDVLNPAVAILLEAGLFALIARSTRYHERPLTPVAALGGAAAFSLGWRSLFLVFHAALYWGMSAGMFQGGPRTPLGFLVRDGLLSTVAIAVVLLLVCRRRTSAAPSRRPGLAATAVVLALAVAAELGTASLG